MSKIRIQWLLIIIAAEIVLIAGLLIWAIMANDKPKQTTTTNTTSEIPAPPPLKPAKVELQQFATGFQSPTVIAATPDPADRRIFIGEQEGVIRIVNPDGKTQSTPFLDIKSKTLMDTEMGLLGMAFHPKFAENGFVYVHYNDKSKNSIIARFTVAKSTGVADSASEKQILKIAQPFSNHKAGAIAFGADSYLYIGLGDGGSAGDPGDRAQNKTGTLLGKILRIDVDHGDPYTVPATNPFANASGAKSEVWAYGLRNPWRISFDRQTGDLYIADVGQGEIEEIDFQPASSKGGENYGWRCFEGTHTFNPAKCQDASQYIKPILEFDHSDGRCSVTGGNVYRGKMYPALAGNYFYSDFCGGQIYSASRASGAWQSTEVLKTDFAPSTFGEDSNGELYLADYKTGTIHRIIDAANPAP